MLRKPAFIAFITFVTIALCMAGCTVNISQPAATITTAPTAPPVAAGQDLPVSQMPVTWSGLNLGGSLVYLVGTQQTNNSSVTLTSLDLASGILTPIFMTPAGGWIYAAAVSPDRQQVALSYATPANFAAIYTLPLDGSLAPQLLLPPPSTDDQYTEPVWSPDGKYIYFAHVNFGQQTSNQKYPAFEIERIEYPHGTPERLVTNAYWPRLAQDGSRLVYVSQDPENGTNRLFVADPDGSNSKEVQLSGTGVPTIIDAPLFLPDGQTILFSAPAPAPAYTPGWLDWLLGVQSASAHNVISEWWSVPAAGGIPTQLTHIQAPGLYASISPDGQWLASFSVNGIFVMHPDGSALTMVVNDVGGMSGTIDWIP